MSGLSGGNAMQSHLAGIVKRIQEAGILRVGFLEGATYPEGETHEIREAYKERQKKGITGAIKGKKGGVSVAEVAAKNEYGAKGVPMRPYFRTMIKNKKANWAVSIGQVLANNNYDIDATWRLMGEGIRGQLQTSIRDWTTPPNSQETIERKGSNKPLIDTGHMLNSVDYDYGKKE